MIENKPLIIPELVALDTDAGSGKEDVIESLATTVAGAGRASSPDGPAADAKKRESTAPAGTPGGIAIPHCRGLHVLAPGLGLARLAQSVDFGAADGQVANLILMTAAPDGADDFYFQLLVKLARGLMQAEFIDALCQATDAEEITRIATKQVQSELLDGGQETEDGEAGEAGRAGKTGSVADSAAGTGAVQTKAAVASPALAEGETVIVGVSSCLTGIAHTFMAAEALEQADKDQGITVAIEGQDSDKIDAPNPELTEWVSAVIFAHDLPAKGRECLVGKPAIDVGVKTVVNDVGSLVGKALAAVDDPSATRVPAGGESAEESEEGSEHQVRRLQRSVMTGVPYMIPLVIADGLFAALGSLLAGYDVVNLYEKISINDYFLWSLPGNEFVHEIKNSADNVVATKTITVPQSGLLLHIRRMLPLLGQAAMSFLVPAPAGYIFFGLAGKPGIAPGFVMGVVVVQVGTGFTGGLVGGILTGYFAVWLAGLSAPARLRGLMSAATIPLGTTLVAGTVMYLALGRPLTAPMTGLEHGLTSMLGGGSAVLLGIILGLMMCFGLGGSINRAVYLFGTVDPSETSASNTAPYEIMATVMAADMVPPLVMSTATFLRSRLFTKAEVENGRSACLLGLSFIFEGVIPFVATDPLCAIPVTTAGGAVTGAMTMAMHVGSRAPHGGVFVAFVITHFGGFLLTILAGAVASTVLVIALKGLGRNADGKKGVEAQAAVAA